MRIGVPKEIKNGEHRVALTPEGAATLIAHGHTVLVQHDSGRGCGYNDATYADAGAQLVTPSAEAWAADLIIKVKEPLPAEYRYLQSDVAIFTYLHLAACPELTKALQHAHCTALGYETVQEDTGALPLLAPMSRIAGRVAAQMAARYLQSENSTPHPGLGILPGGIKGSEPAQVLILGGGNAGTHAAQAAIGLGARVTLLDTDAQRLAQLQHQFADDIALEICTPAQIKRLLPQSHIVIGAALIPGAHAPQLLGEVDIATMMEGSVLIDIAIDQGGISATSHPTSYADPIYTQCGVIHCCLPNLPSAVARTATQALTHATLPWILRLADEGIDAAITNHPPLARGLNVQNSVITHPAVAHDLASLHTSAPSAPLR
ncbi:MAG: alanine dehydrogenase [Mariprofundales bacterium]